MNRIRPILPVFASGLVFATPFASYADPDSVTVDDSPPQQTTTVIVTPGAEPDSMGYAWHDPALASGIGVSVVIGGGVVGFVDRAMRDVSTDSVSGIWNVRATLGSHLPLGLDIGYVGTAGSLRSLTGTSSGTLIGTTAEAALRWNVLPHYAWTPYAFAGAGWQRYDVSGATFTRADNGIVDSDNSIVFPLGAGVAFRGMSGFVLDVHGTFRASTRAGLVLEGVNSSTFAPLHTWEASAGVGYEF